MKQFSRLCLQGILVLCAFNYCVDGFSMGRNRLRRDLSKRIENNGFDMFSIINNLNTAYQYTTSMFNSRTSNNAQKGGRSIGTENQALSGVPGCKKCFLGLQVSQREAYVELVLKVSEWFGFLVAQQMFPDPDLIEKS